MIIRGNGRQDIFIDRRSRIRMMRLIHVASLRTKCEIHAVVFMTNHAHVLVQVGSGGLSKMMQEVTHRYAQYINKRRGTDGHVFQGRFNAYRCATDARLLNVLRYIHRNPVKHGAVAHPAEWEWSSYNNYVELPSPFPSRLVKTDFCLSLFGAGRGRIEAFNAFMGARADARWPHKRLRRKTRPSVSRQKTAAGPIWLPPLERAIEAFSRQHGVRAAELIGNSKERRLSRLRRRFSLDASRDGYSLQEIARALKRSRQSVFELVRQPCKS
ncbi:MAG: transposase [Elusimicrobia bacterium]|nr:transposase [Elusimicrobiota bacterium]